MCHFRLIHSTAECICLCSSQICLSVAQQNWKILQRGESGGRSHASLQSSAASFQLGGKLNSLCAFCWACIISFQMLWYIRLSHGAFAHSRSTPPVPVTPSSEVCRSPCFCLGWSWRYPSFSCVQPSHGFTHTLPPNHRAGQQSSPSPSEHFLLPYGDSCSWL